VASPAAVLRGVGAALRVPLWIGGSRWRTLLGASASPRHGRASAAATEATRCAHVALRVLSRLPGGAWRSTCLYRSIAECLVLRGHGVDARLRIGVAREGAEAEGIIAHAWVLLPGQSDHEADARAAALRVLDSPA
jgi:hypothetical protein